MLPFFVILSYYSIMISLDGKKLSQKILAELKQEIADMAKKLRLAVVVIGQNPVTQKFIQQKPNPLLLKFYFSAGFRAPLRH